MVTLKQYMQMLEVQELFANDQNKLNKEILKIFNLEKLTKIEADKKILEISSYMNAEIPLVKKFKLSGVEFGFIPNLNNISVGEWVDLDIYQTRKDSLHKIMAILYRPIINKLGETYSIEPYDGTEKYEKLMLETDVQIFNSAMVFFYTLSKQLLEDLNTYIQNQTKKSLTNKNLIQENL
jgi:hypothetical protein